MRRQRECVSLEAIFQGAKNWWKQPFICKNNNAFNGDAAHFKPEHCSLALKCVERLSSRHSTWIIVCIQGGIFIYCCWFNECNCCVFVVSRRRRIFHNRKPILCPPTPLSYRILPFFNAIVLLVRCNNISVVFHFVISYWGASPITACLRKRTFSAHGSRFRNYPLNKHQVPCSQYKQKAKSQSSKIHFVNFPIK